MKKIILVLLLLLIGGAIFYIIAPHDIMRCYFVKWSDLDHSAPDLYIDPNMPESQKQVLQTLLAEGKKNIAALYGEVTAKPIIIAGHTMDIMRTYGGNTYNRAGRTYLTVIANFIILGPDGVGSIDVLSHELAHTELSARIGHGNRGKIPIWFDEGLAMQFDDRYSIADWQTRTDNGKTAPDLSQIGIITHDDWLGYATAKHEVDRWLDAVGQTGLLTLLQSVRNGDEFYETYRAIEQAHAIAQ